MALDLQRLKAAVVARFPHPPPPLSRHEVRDLVDDELDRLLALPQYDPTDPGCARWIRTSLKNAVLMEFRRVTGRGRYSEEALEEWTAHSPDETAAAEARVWLCQVEALLLPNQARYLRRRVEGYDLADVATLERRGIKDMEATDREVKRKIARANARFPAEVSVTRNQGGRRRTGQARVVTFRADHRTERLLKQLAQGDETTSDVIRRALRELAEKRRREAQAERLAQMEQFAKRSRAQES